jgi:hypothetical protein
MHARYAVHHGIRSGEITLVILRATVNVLGRESYNTTLEMFVQKQRACKVVVMA